MTCRVLVLAVLAIGCRVTGTFECERSEQCRSIMGPGTCEPTGFCSFADPACPTGLRYSEHAGDGHANQCTMVPIVPDATPFSVASCPSTYDLMLPSTAMTSRYRVVSSTATFWAHEELCNQDLAGATHAINIDTALELGELAVVLDANAVRLHYVGIVQDPAATAADAGWINLDGTPMVAGLWSTAAAEPDDGGDGEADHASQVAMYDRQFAALRDSGGVDAAGMVCECDGLPVSAMARAFIDTDPNNPNP